MAQWVSPIAGQKSQPIAPPELKSALKKSGSAAPKPEAGATSARRARRSSLDSAEGGLESSSTAGAVSSAALGVSSAAIGASRAAELSRTLLLPEDKKQDALRQSTAAELERKRQTLRRMRRDRLNGVKDVRDNDDLTDIQRHAVNEFIPTMAFGSSCPAELLCNVRSRQICGGHKNLGGQQSVVTVQYLCGNPTDLVTRDLIGEAEKDAALKVFLKSGDMLGFETLEQAEWQDVREPRAFNQLELKHPDDRRLHMDALECFGLSTMKRTSVARGLADALCLTVEKSKIPATKQDIMNTIKQLLKVDHANICKLLEVCEDEDNVYLLYEDCPGAVNLAMRIRDQHWLIEPEAARLMQELAAGVAAANKYQLSVLDWSIWSCMCMSMNSLSPVKIFGAGLAGVFYSSALSHGWEASSLEKGSFFFHSPELCKVENGGAENPYTKLMADDRKPSDVWSIGAILVAGLTGKPPCHGKDPRAVRELIIKGEYHQLGSRISGIHDEGVKLIQRALILHSKSRPSANFLIVNPWIMTQSTNSGDFVASQTVDYLLEWVRQPPLQKAIGRLLAETLAPDKRALLGRMFRSVDVRGDGLVDGRELVAVAAHRRQEIRDVFERIGQEEINEGDFALANIFQEGILSERMLEDIFYTVDGNGNGSISAAELYCTMQTIDPSLTFESVCDFLCDCDFDSDLKLDYKEFRRLFPVTHDVRRDQRELRAKLIKQRVITLEAYDELKEDIKGWIEKIRFKKERIYHIRLKNQEKEHGGTMAIVNQVAGIMQFSKKTAAKPPTVKVPPEIGGLMGIKRLKKVDPLRAGGVFSLDYFLLYRMADWGAVFKEYENVCREINIGESQELRQLQLEEMLPKGLQAMQDVMTWTEAYTVEQDCMFEAQVVEDLLPAMPWARKGIPLVSMMTLEEMDHLDQVGINTLEHRRRSSGKYMPMEQAEHVNHATLKSLWKKLGPVVAQRLGLEDTLGLRV